MSWLAVLALVGFAANSILARLALRGGASDPATFTAVRIASGALVLALIVLARGGGRAAPSAEGAAAAPPTRGRPAAERWTGALLLFLYAAPFSFAYLSLPAGTGALILFGAVQLTMIGAGLRAGERPHTGEWLGLAAALGGLVYLNLPGLQAPPLRGALLMAVAGAAWGLYSLRGRRAGAPLRRTAESFVFATPFGLALAAAWWSRAHLSAEGLAWAVLSGAVASGGGYAAWYAVLPRLSATRAGTVQLTVPILAATAGVLLLGEQVTARLAISAVLVLGGVAGAVRSRAG